MTESRGGLHDGIRALCLWRRWWSTLHTVQALLRSHIPPSPTQHELLHCSTAFSSAAYNIDSQVEYMSQKYPLSLQRNWENIIFRWCVNCPMLCVPAVWFGFTLRDMLSTGNISRKCGTTELQVQTGGRTSAGLAPTRYGPPGVLFGNLRIFSTCGGPTWFGASRHSRCELRSGQGS